MPASIAASMTAKLLGSSTVKPKFMVPRPIRLTSRPERPKCAYVISSLMPEHTDRRYREGCPVSTPSIKVSHAGRKSGFLR
jgi:hypothetical protein